MKIGNKIIFAKTNTALSDQISISSYLPTYYLNVTNFIKKRDDPAVLMRTLGDDGSVQTIECDLGYYLNLVLMYRYTATEFKRFRIDLSRSMMTSSPTRQSPSLRSAT